MDCRFFDGLGESNLQYPFYSPWLFPCVGCKAIFYYYYFIFTLYLLYIYIFFIFLSALVPLHRHLFSFSFSSDILISLFFLLLFFSTLHS